MNYMTLVFLTPIKYIFFFITILQYFIFHKLYSCCLFNLLIYFYFHSLVFFIGMFYSCHKYAQIRIFFIAFGNGILWFHGALTFEVFVVTLTNKIKCQQICNLLLINKCSRLPLCFIFICIFLLQYNPCNFKTPK